MVFPLSCKDNRKESLISMTRINLVVNVLLQFNGYTPSTCWNQIYERIKKLEKVVSESSVADVEVESGYKSGSDMFGFSNSKVAKLIKVCCS